jgi:ribosome maturation factor RimP
MDLVALREEINGLLPAEAFLVDLEFTGDSHGRILRVLVDTDTGVRVDQLAEFNRAIGQRMDELEWLDKAYRLEVNSPGLAHELDHPRLLARAVGRKIRLVHLVKSEGEEVEKELRGTLRGLTETELELDAKTGTQTVARDTIRSIRYWLEW